MNTYTNACVSRPRMQQTVVRSYIQPELRNLQHRTPSHNDTLSTHALLLLLLLLLQVKHAAALQLQT
jgi:hypothetical protein